MRKDLLAIGLGIVLSGAAVFSSFAADANNLAVSGNVPAVVANGRAQLNGAVPSDEVIHFSIALPLRNRSALTNLIDQIYDRNSANYRHYLTPAQFTEHFGPSEDDYQKVIDFAKSKGLAIDATHPNRVLLSVSGNAATIENAFSVHLNRYQHPTQAREFFAPDKEPSFSSTLPILEINGLNNYNLMESRAKLLREVTASSSGIQPRGTQPAGASPAIGSGPQGGYQGADFRNAYVPGVTSLGEGQNVALVQFDGFFASDIAAYEAGIGLTSGPNLVVVPIDGGVPVPGGNSDEVSLDIEMVISMAPKVSNIYLYEAPNPSPWIDMVNRIANDNLARQVSSSWGGPTTPAAQQVFQQMAVQGQSFLQASGDSDAVPAGRPIVFPSDSPYITVVGGTTLTMSGTGAAYVSETVWNWGNEFGPAFDGEGSTGGSSTLFPIPSWQTNINFTTSHASATARNLPDVAMTGDNVWVMYGGGQKGIFGGTSCAAPLWAGFMALVNEQAAAANRPSVGFVNPALYAIANSANYATCFHDTTTGNNTWSLSPNAFFAAPNYDLCTGLGTPQGANLINALLASDVLPAHLSPPPPPYSTNLAAVRGGNANGPWYMFIQDDAPVSSGLIANGWMLALTTADLIGTAGDIELLMNTTNTSALTVQPVTFVLTATNYGPSISTNVSVTDNLPDGTTIISTNATQGSVSRSGSTLTWNIGTLSVGSGAGLVVTVQPNNIGSFFDTATVFAGTPDPNPDDDTATATVNVIPSSVSLTSSLSPSNHMFQINIPGPSGVTVIIQANSNLVSTNWVNVYTGMPPINFTDPATSNYVSRFYRALLLP